MEIRKNTIFCGILCLLFLQNLAAFNEQKNPEREKVQVSLEQIEEVLDLQKALFLALESYPQVLMAEAELEVFSQRRASAWGQYLPKIDLRASRGLERSRSPSLRAASLEKQDLIRKESTISLRQLLFDGFASSSRIKRADKLFKRAEFDLLISQELISLHLSEAYVHLLRNKELLGLAFQRLKKHESFLATVTEREKKGLGKSSDTEQAKGRLALAKAKLKQSELEFINAMNAFELLVGKRPSHLLALHFSDVEKLLPKDTSKDLPKNPFRDRDFSSTLQKHLFVQLVQSEIQALEASVEEAKASFWPQLYLQVDAADRKNIDGLAGKSSDMQAAITLNYNLFNGMSDLANKRAFEAELREKLFQLEQVKKDLVQDLELSWNSLELAKAELNCFLEHKQSSLLALQAFEDQYLIAKRSLFDLLNSADELFTAEESLIYARYNLIMKAYELLYVMGTLRQSLIS